MKYRIEFLQCSRDMRIGILKLIDTVVLLEDDGQEIVIKKISMLLNMNFVKLNAEMIGVAGKEFKMKSPHNAGFFLLGAARGQARRILESWQYAQKSLENFV